MTDDELCEERLEILMRVYKNGRIPPLEKIRLDCIDTYLDKKYPRYSDAERVFLNEAMEFAKEVNEIMESQK